MLKGQRCQHATQLFWSQNLNRRGQSEFTDFDHKVNFFEIGHIVALDDVDWNGHGGDEDQLGQEAAELTAERNDVGALSFLVSIWTDDGQAQHGWVVAVDVGVDGDVGNEFHDHERECGDVQDSHQVGAFPVRVDAILIVQEYFLQVVKCKMIFRRAEPQIDWKVFNLIS